jgi:8-oxo-dGTP pyrophosphatase MutT (NUDIX family)
MTPLSRHAQAFLRKLNTRQLDWLKRYALQNRQDPPDDWIAWWGDDLFLGWLPRQRAQQLVVFMRRCTLSQQTLIWNTRHQNSLERSHDVQSFLKDQAQKGRLTGWRNEFYSLWPDPATPPDPGISPWLCIERAGFRHLGLMSHAVHINGFCADGSLWCGHRASGKTTDPDLFDNLTAGGLPAGEKASATAERELFEEAGLTLTPKHSLSWAGAVRTQRTEPQGWHDEVLWVYNLDMPESFQPHNKDGEVQAFYRWCPGEVITHMQDGQFTSDAIHALCQGLGLHACSN